MKVVTSYEDSKGGLHNTPQECMQREILMQVGKLLGCSNAAKKVADSSYAVVAILQKCHESLVKVEESPQPINNYRN